MSTRTADIKRPCQRCRQSGDHRTAFVFREDGIAARLRHGTEKHDEVFTIEEMKHFLAMRGFAVVAINSLRAA